MREKILEWKEKYPIVLSIVLGAIWIFMLLGVGTLSVYIPVVKDSKSEYLSQILVEIVGTALGIFAIWLMKYQSVYREKRYGMIKGLFTGMYLLVVSVISFFALYSIADRSQIRPVWQIVIFFLTMILIGTCEEFMFRGVVSNLLFDKYGKSSAGVWFSVVMTGVIFGSMHIFNAISLEISFYGALIQSFAAGVLGMVLTAIYFRTRSIWLLVFLHAFIDVAGLFVSGVYGTSIGSVIDSYSAKNLISIIPYSIVLIVLLRKKKMNEILENEAMPATKNEVSRLIILIVAIMCGVVITFVAGFDKLVQEIQQSQSGVVTSSENAVESENAIENAK